MVDMPFGGSFTYFEHFTDFAVCKSVDSEQVKHLLGNAGQAAQHIFQVLQIQPLFRLVP
jgi:uncharacterized protein Smg (DUF494 family)